MANDVSVFNAEVWSQTSLITMEENLVISLLFNRDFDKDFHEKGDTVHTRRLGTFNGVRLVEGGTVTAQDLAPVGVDVKLNQQLYTAFVLTERDMQRSFIDLVQAYLQPSLRAIVEGIDRICAGEIYNFYKNQVGDITAAIDYDVLVDANKTLSRLNNPKEGRMLIVGTAGEADLLKTGEVTEMQTRGDGTALINGSIGRSGGFEIPMSQVMPELATGHATVTGAINNASGYIKGTTALTVDGFSAAITSGAFVVVNGQVHRVASTTGGATPTVITIESPGLYAAVADNDVVKVYTPGAVNEAAGYAAGYEGAITFDGAALTTKAPQVGQGIAFGTAAEIYSVYSVSGATFTLNRPLDAAVADNAAIAIFPTGSYQFAMRPGCATVVVKSMPAPPSSVGVQSSIAQENGFAIRVMLSYDRTIFRYMFSADCLVGVKTLDTNQGAIIVSSL